MTIFILAMGNALVRQELHAPVTLGSAASGACPLKGYIPGADVAVTSSTGETEAWAKKWCNIRNRKGVSALRLSDNRALRRYRLKCQNDLAPTVSC